MTLSPLADINHPVYRYVKYELMNITVKHSKNKFQKLKTAF